MALAASAVLALAMAESGRAADRSGKQVDAASVSPYYRIGPDDQLQIVVRGESELSGTYPVRPDGRITVPLLDPVEAVGKTPPDLAELLKDRLAQYIQAPDVTVLVTSAQGTFQDRIRVIGDAVPPRTILYREGITALDVVLQIGGLPATADGDGAYILRREDGELRRIPLDLDAVTTVGGVGRNRPLKPGDVLVLPEGFLTGTWQLTPSVRFEQTYTDNVDLEPDDEKEAALITRVGPAVSLNADLARLQGALNASASYERQSLTDSGDDVDVSLAGAGKVEWLESFLFTDVSASVAEQNLGADSTSSSGIRDANRQTVQTYRLSPYVVKRLSRLAQMQIRYTGTLTDRSDDDHAGSADPRFRGARATGDSTTIGQTGSVTLASGPRFGRWSWTLNGRASEQRSDDGGGDAGAFAGGGDDVSRRSARFSSEYAVSTNFFILGTVGYQTLDSGDARDDFEAPIYRGGFRWTPSPDTRIQATIGQEDDDETLTVDARHDISPHTSFSMSYDEEVATGDERLVANLPEDRDQVDGFDPRGGARLTFRGQVTRTQTVSGRFNTMIGRNSVGLNASYQTQQEDAVNGDTTEETLRMGVQVDRPLTRDLDLSLDASYANTQFYGVTFAGADTGAQEDVEDDVYRTSMGLNYTGLRNVALGIRYSFSKRKSTAPDDDFTENTVTVSGSLRF